MLAFPVGVMVIVDPWALQVVRLCLGMGTKHKSYRFSHHRPQGPGRTPRPSTWLRLRRRRIAGKAPSSLPCSAREGGTDGSVLIASPTRFGMSRQDSLKGSFYTAVCTHGRLPKPTCQSSRVSPGREGGRNLPIIIGLLGGGGGSFFKLD